MGQCTCLTAEPAEAAIHNVNKFLSETVAYEPGTDRLLLAVMLKNKDHKIYRLFISLYRERNSFLINAHKWGAVMKPKISINKLFFFFF